MVFHLSLVSLSLVIVTWNLINVPFPGMQYFELELSNSDIVKELRRDMGLATRQMVR